MAAWELKDFKKTEKKENVRSYTDDIRTYSSQYIYCMRKPNQIIVLLCIQNQAAKNNTNRINERKQKIKRY